MKKTVSCRRLSLLAALLSLAVANPAEGALLFSEGFAYANGDLAGNNGGTGWLSGSAWSGGTGSTGNLVANPLPGTSGNSIQIASNASETSRPLNTTYTSGGATSFYLSFLFNAAPFQGFGLGQYAGVSIYMATNRSDNLLAGMPGDSGGFGFDWTNRGQPNESASNNTTYLTLLAIAPGTTGTTSVAMHVTTDLMLTGTDLITTTPLVSMLNEPNFSFDSVGIAGSYTSGTIGIAGLAMADNPNEAVSFTQAAAIPEPGTWTAAALLAGGAALMRWRKRRAEASKHPA